MPHLMGMASTYTLSWEAKRLIRPRATSVKRQAAAMGPASSSMWPMSQPTFSAKYRGAPWGTSRGRSCVTGQMP